MTKSKLTKICMLVTTTMLLCNLHGWTQSVQPGAQKASTATPAQSSKKMTDSEEQIQRKANPNAVLPASELQLQIQQTKAALESGIAQNRLTDQQITEMKAKIASMERKAKTTSSAPSAEPERKRVETNLYRTILVSKQFTRSQFVSLSENEQRTIMKNASEYMITDLVNAKPGLINNRQSNAVYLTQESFNNADVLRKMSILNNPESYIVVGNSSSVPKSQISKTEFDALPAAKKQAILESGQYEITN